MREIKFRGKTANGEWVYGSLVYSENVEPAIYFEVGKGSVKTFDFVFIKPETVGQYTGLKDKNGKKIFEGDIVHIDNYDEGWDSVVDFKGGAFAIDVEGRDYDYTAIGWTEYEAVVIGNIHDNPELLEVGE